MTRSRISLPILGLTPAGDTAAGLETALRQVRGVSWVYVNTATEMAYVEYSPDDVSVADLAEAVSSIGLCAVLPDTHSRGV